MFNLLKLKSNHSDGPDLGIIPYFRSHKEIFTLAEISSMMVITVFANGVHTHMKKISAIILFSLLPASFAIAMTNCDLTRFRWDCDIPMQTRPTHSTPSMVYCDDIKGYLTPAQYDTLTRYHRRNINMVLKVNGEYIASPCIPTRQYEYRE